VADSGIPQMPASDTAKPFDWSILRTMSRIKGSSITISTLFKSPRIVARIKDNPARGLLISEEALSNAAP
jgi:hypothetical protein